MFGEFITETITERAQSVRRVRGEIGLHTVSGAAILTVCQGSVAQLAEQVTFNHLVTGSNPVGVTQNEASTSNHVEAFVFCLV